MTMKATWRREIDRAKTAAVALDDHWRRMAETWGAITRNRIAQKRDETAGQAARLAARYAAKIKGLTQ